MNAAALTSPMVRDPFMPRPPQGMGPGLALALLAHALLIAALAFGVNWRTSEPQAVVAELWSAVPQFAAPRAVEPPPSPTPTPPSPPSPPPPPQRAPEPVAKPAPEPTPSLDAQIAVEKAAQRKEQLERDRLAAEREKASTKEREQARLKAAQAKAERTKRDAAEEAKAKEDAKTLAAKQAQQQAAARESYQRRMRELAGATGGPTDTGSALRSSGPSAGYAGRIMARIKPNIVFNDVVDGNPMATVEVKLALDGTIVAKRLVKSSGVKSWDDAVLRAIERTEILPRDTDGRVPPPFQIDFKLRE